MIYRIQLVETKTYEIDLDAHDEDEAIRKAKELWFENDYEDIFRFKSSFIDNSQTKVIGTKHES